MSETFNARVEFLTLSEAKPTNLSMFVIWASLWMKAGNRVNVQINESLEEMQRKDGVRIDMVGYDYWTPTNGGFNVPKGRGSSTLALLVVDDLAPISHLVHDKKDEKKYGLSTVNRIARDADGNLIAISNMETPKIPRDIFNMAMDPQKVKAAYLLLMKDGYFIRENA